MTSVETVVGIIVKSNAIDFGSYSTG